MYLPVGSSRSGPPMLAVGGSPFCGPPLSLTLIGLEALRRDNFGGMQAADISLGPTSAELGYTSNRKKTSLIKLQPLDRQPCKKILVSSVMILGGDKPPV